MGSSLLHVRYFVVMHGLSSCGTKVVECMDSVAVVRGLSYFVACGILIPLPVIETMSPELQGRIFTIGPSGKSQA